MWKYVSRRLKDTVERGVSYFEARNVSDSSLHSKIVSNAKPLSVYTGRRNKCWDSIFGDCKNNCKYNKKWYYEQLSNPWIGAITWSSALILGWYASQLLCFSNRRHNRNHNDAIQNPVISKIHPLIPLRFALNQPLFTRVKDVNNIPERRQLNGIAPQVKFVSNESASSNVSSDSAISDSSSNHTSDNFPDVLSAIENKLGLSAIENGNTDGGISMLKSAALRNHAPALYNLGLCYENGIGTGADDKLALQCYRAAAIQEHPTAMYNLAVFYGQGRGGLTKNIETASRLLRMAASKGQEDAVSLLKSAEPKQPPDPPVSKQFINETYLDSPTGLFLQAIGALNSNNAIRKEELIY